MQFIIEQKIAFATNAYYIYKTDDGKTKQGLFAYVQQKRIAIRERVLFYSDEAKTEEIFSLRAEKRMDVHGKYFVEDSSGQPLGYMQRQFKASLLRSTWKLFDNDGNELFTAREQSQVVAILRRFGDFIPYISFIFNLLPYHFEFIKDTAIVGRFSRQFALRDKYVIEYAGAGNVRSESLAALGVALDVLQSR